MKRLWLPGLAGLLGLVLVAGSSFSADQPTTTQKADKHQKHTANKPVAPEGAKTATMAAPTKQASRTHLPAGFGKVNMTPEQHQKALAVMDKYAAEIKQLESQIHGLKAKRDGELNALLSETQKKSLADVKTNAQKARVEKKAAAKTLAAGTGSFHIDPNELKAIHDQAMKDLAKVQGHPQAEGAAAGVAPHKIKKNRKAAATQASKEESKPQSSQPAQSQPDKSQPEKK